MRLSRYCNNVSFQVRVKKGVYIDVFFLFFTYFSKTCSFLGYPHCCYFHPNWNTSTYGNVEDACSSAFNENIKSL